ncbi:hypothetical protein OH77DRAFT_1506545 [Trametes cingulata]|nr:hypothetical protein OH77DRAFT_1506545 [Trametes cingulata]
MAWLEARGALLLCIVHFLLTGVVWAGNTTCASGQLDWYTSVVGESPCITYQRLRQICNGDYQVPDFRPNTPGDNCDDQVSACCCNTVAFQLSMLCMNCQQDHLAGNQVGIDAGVGAYGLYRASCGAGTNHSLPNDIQKAVCNLNIRLDNFLYGGWDDGAWDSVFTKESAERDHAVNNNNTFTHCPDQISPTASATPAASNVSSNIPTTNAPTASTNTGSRPTQSTADLNSDDNNKSSSPVGAIVGGVVGGIIVILAAVGFFLLRRYRARRSGVATRGIQDTHQSYDVFGDNMVVSSSMSQATPYAGMATQGAAGPPADFLVPSAAPAERPTAWTSPSWSDYSSAVPPSTVASEDALRHRDAGPLTRSLSGRLPPAYRSWEEDSNVDSDAHRTQQGSAQSAVSEVAPDPHMPLVPLRLELKSGSSSPS